MSSGFGRGIRATCTHGRAPVGPDRHDRGPGDGRDHARPAAGASVAIVGTTRGAIANADGRFLISGAPAGTHVLRARLLGYRTLERSVTVGAGDTARIELVLERDPQVLGSVRTEARSVERDLFESMPNVGTLSVTARSVQAVPRLGEPDIIRVVQLLPGVEARNDFSTGLNVRGGEPDQNLVLIDGYPIYNPFHLGGLFSTFMDATVRDFTLMTGGFPARYGGRLSSVLDVRSAEDLRPGIHSRVDVSVLGATASLGGAFAGGNGTWSLAARRTYADRVVDWFSKEVLPYHFRDAQGHAAYSLPGNFRLELTGYDGEDVLDANFTEFGADSGESHAGAGSFRFQWRNQVLGATLSRTFSSGVRLPVLGRLFGDSTHLQQRLSRSTFATTLDLGDSALGLQHALADTRLSGELTTYSARHDRTLGYEVSAFSIVSTGGSAQLGTQSNDLSQRGEAIAGYIDHLWRASPTWLVQGGLRLEGLTERRWVALSPRLSVKHFLNPDVALTAAAGRFTQWMQSAAPEDGPVRLLDVWVASDRTTPVALAWHYLAGFERRLTPNRQLRIEGYYKQYDRLLESNLAEDPSQRGDEYFPVDGSSYGVDVLLRQADAERLSGWISYTYGVSTRRIGELRYFPAHDRRHNLNVVASWRLAKYLLGARFGFASGTPYTEVVGELVRRIYDPTTETWGRRRAARSTGRRRPALWGASAGDAAPGPQCVARVSPPRGHRNAISERGQCVRREERFHLHL